VLKQIVDVIAPFITELLTVHSGWPLSNHIQGGIYHSRVSLPYVCRNIIDIILITYGTG